MASQFSFNLCVMSDENGSDWVCASMPVGGIAGANIQLFDVSGPYLPAGFQTEVGNAIEWMRKKEKEGFVFRKRF